MTARKTPSKEIAEKQTGPGNDTVFVYESPHGRVIVPSLTKIKIGVMRKIRNLESGDQAFTIIEEVCKPSVLAVIDEFDGDEMNKFMEAWAEFSGVSVGE